MQGIDFPRLTYTKESFIDILEKIAEELVECRIAFTDEKVSRFAHEAVDLCQAVNTLLYKLRDFGADIEAAHAEVMEKLRERGVICEEEGDQSSQIMNFIGPLLDGWDGIPNDEKSYLRDENPSFVRAIEGIYDVVEGH